MYKCSIVIIEKNTKKYLRKCLDSVVNQNIENYEIIIIDDCSDEKSIDIIKEYQRQVVPIKYLYLEESIGPGGARNYGLDIAKGEYILFIDSDDWIDINCLQVAIPIMDQYSADIGMYSLVRNYEYTTIQPYYKCQYSDIQVLNGKTAFKMMSGQYDFGTVISPSPVNKIYKRDYLVKNNILFLKSVYYEDIFWGFQTLLNDGKIITIPYVKYHHYRRMGSIVQSLSHKHFDDLEYIFITIRQYLKEKDMYDEYAYDYYQIFERFFNLLIRQVFEFSKTEEERKDWLKYSFSKMEKIIVIDEYIKYFSSEKIRRHIQPQIKDTTLF